jgi:hypothetical protein
MVTTTFGGFTTPSAFLLADGSILVVGTTGSSNTQVALARYTAGGQADTNFGTAGRLIAIARRR